MFIQRGLICICMKWACLCPYLPRRVMHQQPHDAGFIGGSALHPINRIPIFLADANKKRRVCHDKTASNKIPIFQLIPMYEKAVPPERDTAVFKCIPRTAKILLGFHAINCNGELLGRLFSVVVELVPKTIVDIRETGSRRVCDVKRSGDAVFRVHLDCCLVGRSV